jgi:hypothetical protein
MAGQQVFAQILAKLMFPLGPDKHGEEQQHNYR